MDLESYIMYLKKSGLLQFWYANSNVQSILAFGWVEFFQNGVSLYFSESNMIFLLLESYLECICLYVG